MAPKPLEAAENRSVNRNSTTPPLQGTHPPYQPTAWRPLTPVRRGQHGSPRVDAPSSTTSAPPGSFYIPSLDGLRAVSILLVFVAHAGWGTVVPGGLGVTVFFFLSGYLITTLLRLEYRKNGTISLRNFYLRRVLRIFPPFYAAFALGWLLVATGLLPASLAAGPILAQLFYLGNFQQIYHPDGVIPGSGVLWSLAIEEHFYLLFPLLFLLLQRCLAHAKHRGVVLLSLCLAVVLWRCLLSHTLGASSMRIYSGTDTRLDAILFGCVLAVWGNPMLDATHTNSARWLHWGLPLAICTLAVSLLWRHDFFRDTWRYSLQSLALFPIFVAAIRHPRHFLCRALNHPVVRYLGLISYSSYLLHHTVICLVRHHLPANMLAQALVALALTLCVASLFHYGIEKPCARLRQRWQTRPQAAPKMASKAA